MAKEQKIEKKQIEKSEVKATRSAYSYIKESLKANLKSNLMAWRKEEVITKLDKPSDIGKARMLGYKDKKGFIVVRVRIRRGGRQRSPIHHNRRSVRQTVRKNLMMNYKEVAENRAARKFTNLEVLNSYYLAKDGMSYFFEVILVDPCRPEVQAYLPWINNSANRNRVFRGLTFSGKKSK